MTVLSRAAMTAACVVVASLLAPAAGVASQIDLLPAAHTVLTAPAAAQHTCTARGLQGPGVTTTTFTAPAQGYLSAHLHGGARGDWDLALVDARSGSALAGSQAFGANELVQQWLSAGQTVVLRGCRRSAAAPRSVPLELTFGVGAPPVDAHPAKLVRIALTDTRRQVPELRALGIDVDEQVFPDHADTILFSPAEETRLLAAGFKVKTLVADVVAADRRLLARDAQRSGARLRADAGSNLPSGRTTYRQYEDYQADLKKLVAEHPGVVKAVTLPKKTWQGRDTMGVEISGNVDATDDQKPTSLIVGEHHAREWPSGELTMEFAMYLAQQYGKDDRVTKLLDAVRVVVVPIINGDGFIVSRTAVSPTDISGDPLGAPGLAEGVLIGGGSLAYKRKNCDGPIPSPDAPCVLQFGVDPNRNYGFNWGGVGASSSPDSQSYRGSGPWSEPETQAVHEYSQTRDVTSLLTMHNYASLVLRPPGTQVEGQAPDEARLKVLGDAMAADTGYTSQYGYQLYDTSGTTEDWNYGAAGTFGYTMELGPAAGDSGNFHIAYDRGVVEQWNGTGKRKGRGVRNALLQLAEWAASREDFSTIEGRAPAGRILRLKKTFETSTSPVCAIAGPTDVSNDAYACIAPGDPILVPDKLEYTTKVGTSSRFDWLVTPSTRPFKHKKGETEAWTLTCEAAGGAVYETKQVAIWRGEKQTLEMPCGGTLPAAVSAKDTLAPRSRVLRAKLRATRRGIYLNGTAKDLASKGTQPSLTKVTVALARKVGSKCRFATASGRLTAARSCSRPVFLAAKGTSTWSFVFRHRLAAGRYLAIVRGIDAAGNREPIAKTNRIAFTIR